MDLLILLSQKQSPMTLLQIEQELDIPKSSTFELVYTLVEKGFVEQTGKEFSLGIGAFYVGSQYTQRMDLVLIAKSILDDVARETCETVFLGKYMDDRIVYMDKFIQYASMTSTCPIGSTKELYYTGLGKAILSTWSDDKIREYFAKHHTPSLSPRTITNADDMIAELAKLRELGYCYENREDSGETFCVAAPIFDHSGSAIAAASIAVPFYKVTDELQSYLGHSIRTAADTISARMGYMAHW